jgi:hypothetical protein
MDDGGDRDTIAAGCGGYLRRSAGRPAQKGSDIETS